MSIADNLVQIKNRIKSSAQKVQRNPEDVTLIAVTKYVEIERINEAIAAGITHIAENRVQEAHAKFPGLMGGQVTKHLIGSLQTNKVKTALELFDFVHSVDRLELIDELAKQSQKNQRPVQILIQVNVAEEVSKHGITVDDVHILLERVLACPNLQPCGLMTMAPLADDAELSRPVFRGLRELFITAANQFDLGSKWQYLSMGMSQDYHIAVEEGANLLRIGSAIFMSE